MRGVAFEAYAPMSSYRDYGTTRGYVTYPFPPRTALEGMLAATLGLERNSYVGCNPLAEHIALELLEVGECGAVPLNYAVTASGKSNWHTQINKMYIFSQRFKAYVFGSAGEGLFDKLLGDATVFPRCGGTTECLLDVTPAGEIDCSVIPAGEEFNCSSVAPSDHISGLAGGSPRVAVGIPRAYSRVSPRHVRVAKTFAAFYGDPFVATSDGEHCFRVEAGGTTKCVVTL